jgi:hypothetical protein
MAQYEQKTDSREFEVANPGDSAHARSAEPCASATDIAIRLWCKERSGRSLRLTWQSDSVLVYMIADLVSASGGRVGEESSPIMAAHFDGSRQALVAAKRIQTSVLEFVACRPERIGAAILIYPPSTSSPVGFSGEMALQALGQAKPGQILFSEYSSQQLHDLPGIELRAVPALTVVPGDWQGGLTELVWTTPERLALLQDSVEADIGPRAADSRPVDATAIVTAPARNAPEGHTNEAALPAGPTADFVFKRGPETTAQQADQAASSVRDRVPISDSFQQSSSSLLTEELDESGARSLFTRTRVILGAVAVVLVVVLIFVFPPSRVSKPRTIPQQQQQTGATENPVQQPPATPEPEARTTQPQQTSAKPQAKPVATAQPRPPSRLPSDNHVKNNKENAEEPEAYADSGGVSQKDIPALLGMAQRDAGAGNYDRAKREYKKILSLQPSNQEAKDGLRRLGLIQQDTQQDQQ